MVDSRFAGRTQITNLKNVQSITNLPGRWEGDENSPAVTILNQYDNCCFDKSPGGGNGVVSFLFSYFFSNHYFKCTSQVRKNSQIYTDKLGRANRREKTSTTLSIRGYSCSTTVVFSSSASSSCSDISQ
jgi:hypothetical protein